VKRILLPLIAFLFAATSVFAQATPTATPTPTAFDFPSSPTLNQQVTGPDGQIYVWDGTKWVHGAGGGGGGGGGGAPLINPSGGQNNYAPIANPVFTGSLTLPTSIVCTGGQVLTGISTILAPTCITVGAGGGAPLVNPAGGQNNYLPIDSPAFTSGMSGPQISVTNYVQAGAWMQSPIYQFTPTRQLQYTTSSDLFQYVVNATTNPFIALTIGSDGTLITAGMITTPSLTLNGTLLAIGGTCAAGDFVNTISAAGTPACATPAGGAAGVTSFNTRTGAVVLTQADVTAVANAVYAPLTNPAAGQNNYAPIGSPTFTGNVVINNSTAPSLFWPATGDAASFSIDSYTYGTANLISGGYSASATQYRAATSAAYGVSAIRFYTGYINLTADSITTAGTVFTPTTRLRVSSNGLVLGYPAVGSGATATILNNLGGNFTVAAGGNQAMTQVCGGLWLILDASHGQSTGMYMCSGAECNLIGQSGTMWVASTTTPAASTSSVALTGGSATLYNGWTTATNYRQISVCP
jgi:hypothetical protein